MKSEPFKYSWNQLIQDKSTFWDGVRNYAARNNLRDMKKGDIAFFYHSNEGKEIVGLVEVVKEHYQDPTSDNDAWVVVDIKPLKALANPVSLAEIKSNEKLSEMELVRLMRLSVSKVSKKEFELILKISKTSL